MRTELPRRSRALGIGKEIGGSIYVHRQYEACLPRGALAAAKQRLPHTFHYHVLKYDVKNNDISFVSCPEFDVAPEPTVGPSVRVRSGNSVHLRRPPSDPEIYHHKWLFVADDYPGFDVEASKRRSLAWLALDGVDRRRIGRTSYWERYVAPRIPKT